MQTVIHLLNQKWALIFAFVPGVNILYLLFRFLTVRDKHYNVSIFMLGLAILPIWVLYRILPDSWNWLITHLIVSVIVSLVMYKSRGGYREIQGIAIRKEILGIASTVVFLLVVSSLVAPLSSASNIALEKTALALNAIMEDDQQAWQDLVHPKYGNQLADLHDFKENLLRNGIVLQGEIQSFKDQVVGTHPIEDGEGCTLQVWVWIGEQKYRLNIAYLEGENASGFTDFLITDPFD